MSLLGQDVLVAHGGPLLKLIFDELFLDEQKRYEYRSKR
jgi:hypothetical protein